MAVEVQVAAKGVGNNHDHQPDAVFLPCPLLQHLRTQDGKIVKEMPVLPKQRPEHIRHGEADVGVGDVGKLSPLIPLPGIVARWPQLGQARDLHVW